MDSRSGIYKIVLQSGQFYVGSALNIHRRFQRHVSYLRRGKHANPKLQAAWQEHKEGGLRLEVLEIVDDPQQLLSREQHYIDELRPAL